jgi:hypothetical protein
MRGAASAATVDRRVSRSGDAVMPSDSFRIKL